MYVYICRSTMNMVMVNKVTTFMILDIIIKFHNKNYIVQQ